MSSHVILSTTTATPTTGPIHTLNMPAFTIQSTVVADSGNVTATVTPYVSNDGVGWFALTAIAISSAATPQTGGYAYVGNWKFIKVTATVISGTNAVITVTING